jgi:3'-5' exoribonuclease
VKEGRNGQKPLTPREWVGRDAFPWPRLGGLGEGDRVVACFFVAARDLLRTRQEKPYLKLRLADRYGAIEARIWDEADQVEASLAGTAFVGVRGMIQFYQGERQLRIDQIAPVDVAAEELELFLPASQRSADEMERELRALVRSVADRPLRALLDRVLDRDGEVGRLFRVAPAAKLNHHAYVGGLLEHTLSVARACDAMAQHYGGAIDRDLLLTGAILHDVGKVREIAAAVGFPYTREGKLLGHILLGLQIVGDAARQVPELSQDRLVLVEHLVASHQGRYEWQSPKRPKILEGLILHYVDDLDAKVNQAATLLASADAGTWTAYDRSFAREFLRHAGPDDAPAGAGAGDGVEPARDDAGSEPGPASLLDLFPR